MDIKSMVQGLASWKADQLIDRLLPVGGTGSRHHADPEPDCLLTPANVKTAVLTGKKWAESLDPSQVENMFYKLVCRNDGLEHTFNEAKDRGRKWSQRSNGGRKVKMTTRKQVVKVSGRGLVEFAGLTRDFTHVTPEYAIVAIQKTEVSKPRYEIYCTNVDLKSHAVLGQYFHGAKFVPRLRRKAVGYCYKKPKFFRLTVVATPSGNSMPGEYLKAFSKGLK